MTPTEAIMYFFDNLAGDILPWIPLAIAVIAIGVVLAKTKK